MQCVARGPCAAGNVRLPGTLHPGCAVLRRAIRSNVVSFPSQIPVLSRDPAPDLQWRGVLLYFVRGWSSGDIAQRFHVPVHRIRTLLSQWAVRALALGYVQIIDASGFADCCRMETERRILLKSDGWPEGCEDMPAILRARDAEIVTRSNVMHAAGGGG